MSSGLAAPNRVLPATVVAFCAQDNLLPHLETALRLADLHFQQPQDVHVTVDTDPETDEQTILIDLTIKMPPDEAVERKRAYTRQWVQAVPVDAIGKIRLLFNIER